MYKGNDTFRKTYLGDWKDHDEEKSETFDICDLQKNIPVGMGVMRIESME